MDAIEKNIHTLLVSIKRSDIYQEYKKQEKILNENPELAERGSQVRADNFRLQNECGRDNLFSTAEQLSRESAELRRIPQVNAYLDAELALCRLMQHVCRGLTAGIDIDIPPLCWRSQKGAPEGRNVWEIQETGWEMQEWPLPAAPSEWRCMSAWSF